MKKHNREGQERPDGFMGYHFIPGNLRQQKEGRRSLFLGTQREMHKIRSQIDALQIPPAAIPLLRRVQALQSTLAEWGQYAASDSSEIKDFAEQRLLEAEMEIRITERKLINLEVSSSDLEQLKLAFSHQQELAEHAHELMLDYSDSQLSDPVTDRLIKDLLPEIDAWVCDIAFGPGNHKHDV